MIDKKDFIQYFEKEVIGDPEVKFFVIAVEGGTPAPELIINHKDSFQTKYDYYREHYDNEMRLIKNPKIQITLIMGMYSMFDLFEYLMNSEEGSENA